MSSAKCTLRAGRVAGRAFRRLEATPTSSGLGYFASRPCVLGKTPQEVSKRKLPSSYRLSLHTTSCARRRSMGHNAEEVPQEAPTTDFGKMDMLGATPVPSTSVDVCMSEGFVLNSGARVTDGSGVLLVSGEAFSWRPWRQDKKLVNAKGQWDVDAESAFALLGMLWPRPDLLIIGVGPEIRPLSPATKKHIGSLGMRVEVVDTRNAASQFNLLATERGVGEVAAALIPIGWREGLGAAS